MKEAHKITQYHKQAIKVKPNNILFFDLDGTLVDTDYANFLSYKKAIEYVKKLDFNMSFDPTHRFNRSSLKNIIPNLTEIELEIIISEKENHYKEFLTKTRLNEETVGILQTYFRTNKTVLVTNSLKDRALETLNYHGLTDKFSNLFFRQFGESNARINKFQNAISNLSISPKLVIAFENEWIEIANAKKVGIEYINPLIS